MNQSNAGPRRKSHIVVQWFDVLFIMALCFVTLLSTMLMRGKVLVGDGATEEHLDYSFHPLLFGAVLVIFGLYMGYMLSHSERELKDMVNHVYGGKEKSVNKVAAPAEKEELAVGGTR